MVTRTRKRTAGKAEAAERTPQAPAERARFHERKARDLIVEAEFHAEESFNQAALAAQRATAHGLLAVAARMEASMVGAAVLSALPAEITIRVPE